MTKKILKNIWNIKKLFVYLQRIFKNMVFDIFEIEKWGDGNEGGVAPDCSNGKNHLKNYCLEIMEVSRYRTSLQAQSGT